MGNQEVLSAPPPLLSGPAPLILLMFAHVPVQQAQSSYQEFLSNHIFLQFKQNHSKIADGFVYIFEILVI
jgi:hypothetical protein